MKFLFILSIAALGGLNSLYGQSSKAVFKKADELTVIGKAAKTDNIYHRLDTAKYSDLPPAVKKLLTNSAGLAISFKTNSTSVSAKWCVTNLKQLSNMTPIANKGLDLYIKNNGKWQFAGVGRPNDRCSEFTLVENMVNSEKEYLMYLPLYDQISDLEIGVDQGATITPGVDPFKKRIIIYGTSIVQGASASRPGLTYPARLSRETSLNFINIGLSGSAKMEKAAADMIASLPADAYVIDCVPNASSAQIAERTDYLISTIRKHHPQAPIIMISSIPRDHGDWDQVTGKTVIEKNKNFEKQYQMLIQKGVKSLYFIPGDKLLGEDREGTIDGTHPNDIGFDRMFNGLKPQITSILKKHGITAD